MARHSKAVNRKKIIGLTTLSVLLVAALGVGAYQMFYPQHDGPSKEDAFAQSSTTKKSEEKPSSSSSVSSSSSEEKPDQSSSQAEKPATWESLTEPQRQSVYAQWVNNAQGKFDLYTGEANRIYLVNRGANGVSGYSDPVDVIQNTARVQVNADGTYYLQVPDPAQTGLRMVQNPWPMVKWLTKETLTGAQLTERYGTEAGLHTGEGQILSVKNTLVPTGQA